MPNKRAGGKGGTRSLFHVARTWPALPQHGRSPPKTAANGADQPRAFLHRSGVTLLEHAPGTPGNVRLNDAMSCGRPNTFAVRPRNPVPQCGTDAAART